MTRLWYIFANDGPHKPKPSSVQSSLTDNIGGRFKMAAIWNVNYARCIYTFWN